jgi:hypothetical protein
MLAWHVMPQTNTDVDVNHWQWLDYILNSATDEENK